MFALSEFGVNIHGAEALQLPPTVAEAVTWTLLNCADAEKEMEKKRINERKKGCKEDLALFLKSKWIILKI